eukprot:353122_1
MSSFLWSFIDSSKQKWNTDKRTFVAYSTAAVITTVSSIIIFGKYIKKRNLETKLAAYQQESINENKVILHMIPIWNFPSHPHPSPYCTKMILFLECNKIPYKIDSTMPKHFYTQKMPWITYKNIHQTDSNLIIKWFKQQKDFNFINMDKHLTEKQLAISDAYKSMIEDALMWIIRYRRFHTKQNTQLFIDLAYGKIMPIIIRRFIVSIIIPIVASNLFWTVGIGRFKPEQVFKKGEDLIKSVVVYIGNNKFFFGDKLSTLDIVIYSHIGAMYQLCSVFTWGVNNDIPSELPFMNEINNYMKRIEMECFSEVKYWKDVKLPC